ncbi:laminin-type epidermal growth factor-like protein [Infectious spleen and kidney necrosis virus]|uniref:Laminin-type epidermal growth factor-like protein n=2 Tax=Infectious spleen and kidney necrosis virus TaxID=180170 RepID=A0A8H2SJ96_ISKNV|nr:laminin-type epidermal growth factor-like protein [Infectious spleen and kidney necrosis virus]UWH18690.1 laminin-type epidermal growth factor-like protein [Infectious spleen and kidney necrosis virus]
MATLLLLVLLTVAYSHATTFYNLEIDNQTTTLSCGVPRETDVKIVWASDSNSLLAEHVVHGEVVHVGRNSSEVLKHGVVLYDGTIVSVIKLKPHPVQSVTCHASRISSDSQPCVGVSCELPTDTDDVTPPPTLLDDGGSGMDDYDDIDEPECLSGNCSDCENVVRYTNGSLECLDECVPGEMPYNMLQCYQSNVTCHCDNGLCRVSYDGAHVCCPDGYYGDPISCQQCPCPEDGPCEVHMGRLVCSSCPPGHIGDTCDSCLNGYYKARDGVCRECACPFNGPCMSENGTIVCVCPVGYAGPQCDVCQMGYFWTGEYCSRCPCDGQCALQHNGQVVCMQCSQCRGGGPCFMNYTDDNSGVHCVDCPTGFVGRYCEQCAPGFFHVSDGCIPCPCPHNGPCRQTGENIICTGCPINTTKDNACEECLDGSFGDPSGLRGPVRPCRRCQCSGNIDDNPVGQCNPETGECLRCLHNTDGFFCDKCTRGYYGNALSPDPNNKCKPCVCSGHGSLHPLCNEYTGQCMCKPNVMGLQCDQCMPGYFNIQTGCEACMCHPTQSMSLQCNEAGQCACKEGFTGLMCTVAIPLPTEAEPEDPQEEEDEYDCPEYEDITSAPPTTTPPPKRECKKKPKPPMVATPPPPQHDSAPAGTETEAPQHNVPIVAAPERAPPPAAPSQPEAPQHIPERAPPSETPQHDVPIVAVVHTPERAPPPAAPSQPQHTPERAPPPAAASHRPPAIQNEVPVVKQSTGEEDDVHLGDIGGMKKGGLLMGIVIGSCMVAAAFIMFAIIGHLFFRFTRCGQYDVTTTEP